MSLDGEGTGRSMVTSPLVQELLPYACKREESGVRLCWSGDAGGRPVCAEEGAGVVPSIIVVSCPPHERNGWMQRGFTAAELSLHALQPSAYLPLQDGSFFAHLLGAGPHVSSVLLTATRSYQLASASPKPRRDVPVKLRTTGTVHEEA